MKWILSSSLQGVLLLKLPKVDLSMRCARVLLSVLWLPGHWVGGVLGIQS